MFSQWKILVCTSLCSSYYSVLRCWIEHSSMWDFGKTEFFVFQNGHYVLYNVFIDWCVDSQSYILGGARGLGWQLTHWNSCNVCIFDLSHSKVAAGESNHASPHCSSKNSRSLVFTLLHFGQNQWVSTIVFYFFVTCLFFNYFFQQLTKEKASITAF